MAPALVRRRRRRLRVHAQLGPRRLVRRRPARTRRSARATRFAVPTIIAAVLDRVRGLHGQDHGRLGARARQAGRGRSSTRVYNNIKADFNAKWWDASVGYYRENADAALRAVDAGPARWRSGWCPPERRRALQEKLVDDVLVTRDGPPDDRHRRLALDLPGAAAGRRGGRAGRGQGGVHDRPADDLPELRPLGRRLGWTSLGEYWEPSSRTPQPPHVRHDRAVVLRGAGRASSRSSRATSEIAFKPLIAEDAASTARPRPTTRVRGTVKSAWRQDGGRHPDGRDGPAERDRRACTCPAPTRTRSARSGSGTPLLAEHAPGVSLVGVQGDRVVYDVGSGDYRSASARASSRPPRSPGTVGGTVPATLSLTLGAPAVVRRVHARASRGTTRRRRRANVIRPRVTRRCRSPTRAHRHGPSGQRRVHAAAAAAGQVGDAFASGGARRPDAAASWSAPVSNDAVTIDFKQSIGANDALRTGTYSKTLTFTLSTTTP